MKKILSVLMAAVMVLCSCSACGDSSVSSSSSVSISSKSDEITKKSEAITYFEKAVKEFEPDAEIPFDATKYNYYPDSSNSNLYNISCRIKTKTNSDAYAHVIAEKTGENTFSVHFVEIGGTVKLDDGKVD